MKFKPATLNHIGIAAQDQDGVARLSRLWVILGLKPGREETVPSEKVHTLFVPLPESTTSLEMLLSTDPAGAVGRFLEKRGPGIHHLSFELATGSLDPICAQLRAEGFKLIYDQARPGAHAMRVNFIHPASAGGILIEVMEPEGQN